MPSPDIYLIKLDSSGKSDSDSQSMPMPMNLKQFKERISNWFNEIQIENNEKPKKKF